MIPNLCGLYAWYQFEYIFITKKTLKKQ